MAAQILLQVIKFYCGSALLLKVPAQNFKVPAQIFRVPAQKIKCLLKFYCGCLFLLWPQLRFHLLDMPTQILFAAQLLFLSSFS